VCPVVEYFPDVEPDTGNELFWKLFSGTPEVQEGSIALSDRPGLGTVIVEEVAERLRVGEERVSVL
jgi:L-alanine-DL-glutamate epimerase-like enolase superfamily enzyme